jgi:molybdopterin molybdotransferase
MHSVEQAREQILAWAAPLPAETVGLAGALGRFAAEPIHSAVDLPPWDNSAMDGYAVRAQDLASAGVKTPVVLSVLGAAPAGLVFDKPVGQGTCVRVFTGSVLPPGADAVVMQEDVQCDDRDRSKILFTEKAPPWENCRLRGEDVKSGAILAAAGDKLTAPRLSCLAAAGIASVRASRPPVVGLLATGNELREPGTPLAPGAIYESNRAGLAALARQAGAIPKIYPLIPDDLAATKSALERAFAECDAVITTGGVSVGDADWVKAAFAEIGGKLEVWQVAMRPGKPFAFGRHKEKLFFGLPGNPASALVTFMVLTRPALRRMQGAREVLAPTIPALLVEALANSAQRRHFMRVTLDAVGSARSAGNQSSHMLGALGNSAGLVDVPPQTTLPAGTLVPLIPWE